MQKSLFDAFIPYSAVHTAPLPGALWLRDDHGTFVPAGSEQILIAAREVIEQTLPPQQALNRPELIKEFLRIKLNSTLEHEIFGMAMLNSQYELIEYVEPFRGTLTQASVYPREVVKMALKANAAAIVIAHNHPSGTLEPSEADKQLTRHLRETLQMVDVRLLDHILVAGNKALSFAERGLL